MDEREYHTGRKITTVSEELRNWCENYATTRRITRLYEHLQHYTKHYDPLQPLTLHYTKNNDTVQSPMTCSQCTTRGKTLQTFVTLHEKFAKPYNTLHEKIRHSLHEKTPRFMKTRGDSPHPTRKITAGSEAVGSRAALAAIFVSCGDWSVW